MQKNKTFHRNKIVAFFFGCVVLMCMLMVRLGYLMVNCSEYYMEKAQQLHERERMIKAARGRILDANGTVLADNKTVCTVSVIHNQIREPDEIVEVLSRELDLSEEYVRKRVQKYSSIEKIKSNVEKETGDRIRSYDLAGVKVDEDYKRYYPYDTLASKVLGFTGGDNQGIIGLEVKYEEVLKGTEGTILTVTDARGVELATGGRRTCGAHTGEGSVYQHGPEYPELCDPACQAGDGNQRSRKGIDHCHQSQEWRTLCNGGCPGIRSESSV